MTGDRPRCFVALTPDTASREVLEALPVVEGTRRTPRGQLHVTLAFLGAIERANGERFGECLPALAAATALPSIGVERIARWPSATLARLVVAELAQPPALADLNSRLNDALLAAGLPLDGRAFRPHVTLARFPRHAALPVLPELPPLPERMGDALSALPPLCFDRLTLYESVLTHTGAEHCVLASAVLTR